MQVAEVMTRDISVIPPHASVREAARRMDQLNVGFLPVCDGNRLVGVITDRDIAVRSAAAGEPPDSTRVHQVMTARVRWCFPDDPVELAERRMSQVQVRRLPVVDHDGRLVGIVALGDLAAGRAPGVEGALRRISQPAAPDRPERPADAGARGEALRRDRRARDEEELRPSSPPQAWYGGHAGDERAHYGLGGSGTDYMEDYQGGIGPEGRRVRGPDRGRRAGGYGDYGVGDYGRAFETAFDRGDGDHVRRDRPIFDRGSEAPRAAAAQLRERSYRGIGPRGYRRADDRIRDDVNDLLTEDLDLDATNIEVSVEERVVRLNGTVSSRADKRRAEALAERAYGVADVQNNLRIVEDLTTANPTASATRGPGGREPPGGV